MSQVSKLIHYPSSNSVEVTWVNESGVVVRCHSYSDRQMDMLSVDLGESLQEHQETIDMVLLNQQPIPLESIVHSCSPWQIRKALNAQGLRAQIESMVLASNDQELKDGWEFATEFRSDDPFVLSVGAAVGKTEAETVAIIQYAAGL